jgi:hypothetical protein
MSLGKATFIKLVKVHHYGLCGYVAACYIKSMVVCVLCRVKLCTAHSTHTTDTSNYVARAAIPSFEKGKEPFFGFCKM